MMSILLRVAPAAALTAQTRLPRGRPSPLPLVCAVVELLGPGQGAGGRAEAAFQDGVDENDVARAGRQAAKGVDAGERRAGCSRW